MSFATDLWDQFELVNKYSTDKRKEAEEYMNLLRERVAAEDSYAKALERIANHANCTSITGSLAVGINIMKLSCKNKATQARFIADSITDDPIEHLKELLKTQGAEAKKWTIEGRRLDKDVKAVQDRNEKAQTKYTQICKAHTTANEVYKYARNKPDVSEERKQKYLNKYNTTYKEASEFEEICRDSVNQVNLMNKMYQESMKVILQGLQDHDMARMEAIKDSLKKLIIYETSALKNIQYDIEDTFSTMEGICPEVDIKQFIDEHVSGDQPPEELVFKNYDFSKDVGAINVRELFNEKPRSFGTFDFLTKYTSSAGTPGKATTSSGSSGFSLKPGFFRSSSSSNASSVPDTGEENGSNSTASTNETTASSSTGATEDTKIQQGQTAKSSCDSDGSAEFQNDVLREKASNLASMLAKVWDNQVLSEEEKKLFSRITRGPDGRQLWCDAMKDYQNAGKFILDEPTLEAVAELFNRVLTECYESSDANTGKECIGFASSFYFIQPNNDDETNKEEGEESSRPKRIFLQELIKDHKLWKSIDFWEALIFEGIKNEFKKDNEFVSEVQENFGERKEREVNVVFGQLATYEMQMLSISVDKEVIWSIIGKFCETYDMPEERRETLKNNIENYEAEREKMLSGGAQKTVPRRGIPKWISEVEPSRRKEGSLSFIVKNRKNDSTSAMSFSNVLTSESTNGETSLSSITKKTSLLIENLFDRARKTSSQGTSEKLSRKTSHESNSSNSTPNVELSKT
eukprot:CAMPEP_0115042218 /NCGR_PEP_ID=MMETSP0216-20121206/46140_1 /TAXON_ID=223996 /ORGANISM="Protocruzia adherens, Strain Boccale" /LENGTH=747 /DNA_ID=CAMNT_0002424301 /DNA_START=393 /DNA_END=2632 /DNA_ORIENTATION=-